MTIMSEHYKKLRLLKPTSDEIKEYALRLIDTGRAYNRVTSSGGMNYFIRLHSTTDRGIYRLHTDLGSGGVHLKLDENSASQFIHLIERRRNAWLGFLQEIGSLNSVRN